MTASPSRYRRQRASTPSAFTLVELLVVIGIIALLLAILLPALSKSREQAKTVQCLSNLRQIAHAAHAYAAEWKGYTVPGYGDPATRTANGVTADAENYATVLVNGKYLPAPVLKNLSPDLPISNSVFFCPAGVDDRIGAEFSTTVAYAHYPVDRRDTVGATPYRCRSKSTGIIVDTWYGINATLDNFSTHMTPSRRIPDNGNLNDWSLVKMSQIPSPSEMVFLFDGAFLNLHHSANRINARHNRRTQTNVLFFDGHAQTFATRDLNPGGVGPYANGTNYFTLARCKDRPYPRWRIDQR